MYWAIMDKKIICDPLQSTDRLIVFKSNRLLTGVGTRHHQKFRALLHHKNMKRSIGKHDADPIVSRSHVRSQQRDGCVLMHQHNRSLQRAQRSTLFIRYLSHFFSRAHGSCHHGERLPLPPFSLSQVHHGRLICCVNSEMKSPTPLTATI